MSNGTDPRTIYPHIYFIDPTWTMTCALDKVVVGPTNTGPIMTHQHTDAEWAAYQSANSLPDGYPRWETGVSPPVPQGARDYRKQPLAKGEKAAPVEYNPSMFQPVTPTAKK